jgi:hypothetical protein
MNLVVIKFFLAPATTSLCTIKYKKKLYNVCISLILLDFLLQTAIK